MADAFIQSLPVLERFAEAADGARYRPLPPEWRIGLTDVVNSTAAVAAGRYKAVNLAGAGTISAVANALGGRLPLAVFNGDGAHFAVPPDQAGTAAAVLAGLVDWAREALGLELRAGMTSLAEVRAAGHEVRAAFWRASDEVRYAMFAGGGMEWAEARLKQGQLALPPGTARRAPDLTGLSCLWGEIRPPEGKVVSLIVKKAAAAGEARFAEVAGEVIAAVDEGLRANPVPAEGPPVRWPSAALALQARAFPGARPAWRRWPRVLGLAGLSWLLFRLGRRVGRFDPARYRREIALNTDFRKYNDALMMTVACGPETVRRLRAILEEAVAEGVVRYGLHLQDRAIMTCVVPSALAADHLHFVDGAEGGYATAARQLEG